MSCGASPCPNRRPATASDRGPRRSSTTGWCTCCATRTARPAGCTPSTPPTAGRSGRTAAPASASASARRWSGTGRSSRSATCGSRATTSRPERSGSSSPAWRPTPAPRRPSAATATSTWPRTARAAATAARRCPPSRNCFRGWTRTRTAGSRRRNWPGPGSPTFSRCSTRTRTAPWTPTTGRKAPGSCRAAETSCWPSGRGAGATSPARTCCGVTRRRCPTWPPRSGSTTRCW